MDLDKIVDLNQANGSLGSISYLRASRNDHSWFGALSTFKTELNNHLDFIAGLDLRTYTGRHFQEVTDLLGGQYALDNSDINNPNRTLKVGDKRSYYNDGNVGWQGLFTQLEYNKENFNSFVSAAVSNTSYQRVDYFNYLDNDPLQTTDKYNFTGYSIKGGANYNFTDTQNIFVNVGYFEKAPFFNAVFLQFDNEHINANAPNQKIFSTEIGYGLRGEKLAANINLYRTEWNDRTLTRSFQNPDGTFGTANIVGVNALHQGIEIDATYKSSDKLTLTGMLSLGDWTWVNNLKNIEIYDDNQELVDTVNLYIKGLKVSDAAQTTAALGFDYKVMEKTHFTVDYNYFDNLYAKYDPNDRSNPDAPQAWKAPAYSTFDATIRYGFKLGEFDATVTGRINNIFNTEYISDALDGGSIGSPGDPNYVPPSTDKTALVWFGYGRTFNVSAKIKF